MTRRRKRETAESVSLVGALTAICRGETPDKTCPRCRQGVLRLVAVFDATQKPLEVDLSCAACGGRWAILRPQILNPRNFDETVAI